MSLPTKDQFKALHWAKVRPPSSRWREDRAVAKICAEQGWLVDELRTGGDEMNHEDHVYVLTVSGVEAYDAYKVSQAGI